MPKQSPSSTNPLHRQQLGFIGLTRPAALKQLNKLKQTRPLDVGDMAPALPQHMFDDTQNNSEAHKLSQSDINAKPKQLVVFLRHVGCPFAEQTIAGLSDYHAEHPDTAIIVISHASRTATQAWLQEIGYSNITNDASAIQLACDPSLKTHAAWRIAPSSAWHFMQPRSLWGVLKLLPQGIRNRPAAGTRWLPAAMFLCHNNTIVWAHTPPCACDVVFPASQIA